MYGGGAPAPATAPAQGALSADAQARDAKLTLAHSMPPDVSRLGSTASAVPLNEAELESRMSGMTEDQQLQLLASMPNLHRKILGGG
jgi:hypothetical protein